MGWFAFIVAIASAVGLVFSATGLYVAMGLALFAPAAGWVGYRQVEAPDTSRLAGAAAVALGLIVLLVSATKYGLTLAAVDRLGRLLW